MKPFRACLAVPASIVVLISQVSAEAPTAIRKLAPNCNEKILAEHLAFAPLASLSHRGDDSFFFSERDETINGTARFLPAYARHFNDGDYSLLRRAAEALAVLQRRDSCPSGTNNCSNVNHPNKCCQNGSYCVLVDDNNVGGVACCPNGATCGGGVGSCPSGATSCSQDLGGGCCISGYVCEGVGCVPSASATRTSTSIRASSTNQPATTSTTAAATTTSTEEETTTEEKTTQATTQETTTQETTTEETTTQETTQETTQSQATSTSETTAIETSTGSDTSSATGGAPLRPISSDTTTTGSTQTGCPTGFYGCLATHGGGCCRTDRNCNTHDCPASSTTVVSNGATIVIVATDAPPAADATSTCASGWFLCGSSAGSIAGCCPTGYNCGTASCFTATASHTESVQKQFPDNGGFAPGRDIPRLVLSGFVIAASLLIMM